MKNHERTNGWLAVWILTFILFLVISAVLCKAEAQTWYPTNQATVGWDAVTQLADGNPLPADTTIKYAVYRAAPDRGNQVLLADNIDGTEYVVTLSAEGQYLVGVQAIRLVAGVEVARSTIAWSDDPQAAQVPFGLVYFVPPQAVTGLNVSGQ